MFITQTDVLCNKHNVSNLILSYPFYTTEFKNTTATGYAYWICERGKLAQGNLMTVAMPSFSKSAFFNTFFIHTKSKSQCFQIPPV